MRTTQVLRGALEGQARGEEQGSTTLYRPGSQGAGHPIPLLSASPALIAKEVAARPPIGQR